MKFHFITLFPEKIQSYFLYGLPKKAIEKNIFSVQTINLRDYSNDKFGRVDDTVYGGGPGMLLKIEPIVRALDSIEDKGTVCLLSPQGRIFDQKLAFEFAEKRQSITFLSGYYEGIDDRVREHLVDKELSLGKFVMSSGDLAALCMADAIMRLLPDFMGGELSLQDESYNQDGIMEYPQYTRPSDYKGWKVPDVLLSGNHGEIQKWKEQHKNKIG